LTVVIPIYGNQPLLERVLQCLEREGATSAGRALLDEVLLVNDKPDDAPTVEYIRTLVEQPALPYKILLNEQNLGFVKSVNRGFSAAASGNHILLLNTDTILYPGFFDRLEQYLQALAKEPYRWASLTPATNNGTIATVPVMCEEYTQYKNLARAEAIASICHTVFKEDDDVLEVPVGVGFCMVMNRLVLDEVGLFDEAFSPGYGEEVDWCLRSSLKGHKHFFLPGIFVHHDGGASFSEAKKKLVESHNRMISERYPAFDQAVQNFVTGKENHRFHQVLKPFTEFLGLLQNRRTVIHVLHTDLLRRIGGSEKYIREINRHLLRTHNVSSICLSPHVIDDEQFVSIVIDDRPFGTVSVDSLFYLFQRMMELDLLSIESFTVQHTMNWLPNELDRIIVFFSSLTTNRTLVAHDFYFVCSQHNLLYNDSAYCGAPASEHSHFCTTCTYGSTVAAQRRRSRDLFSRFNRLICPSQSTADILKRVFPDEDISIVVRPHLMLESQKPVEVRNPSVDERIRCVYLGIPTAAKGRYRFESFARRYRDKFEWVTVGAETFLPLEFSPRHLPYNFLNGDDIREILAPLAPAFVILASTWPETFSYTLHEALNAGLPVLTTAESGNIANIVSALGCGRVFGTPAELEDYLGSPKAELLADIAKLSFTFETPLNIAALTEIFLGAPETRWSLGEPLEDLQLTPQA